MDGETVTLREHLEALRGADDRRYAEVAAARSEALKIKEKADEMALGLARDAQRYRDEQANNLRSQIERERGGQATKHELAALADRFAAEIRSLSDKFDAAHKPVVEFMAAQIARTGAVSETKDSTRLNINTVAQSWRCWSPPASSTPPSITR